jgi:hypothetical protein
MQMGNASNAARSGMSIGGGSYLAGQRQAGIAATNANNQATLDWLKGQAGITGDAATRAANAATTNTNNVQQSNVLNTGHTWDVQDRTSTAEATNLGNKVSDTVTNLQNDLKSYGIDVAARHGATNALASSLVSAVNQAPAGSPEQAAAVAKVQAYKSKLESAKQKWNQTKGKDLFPVTVSFDDYLKALEKQGVFNV